MTHSGIQRGGSIAAMATAKGTFEVALEPQASHNVDGGTIAARLSLDKQFNGDLTATSVGEMLIATTPIKGSAGYVAIETVTGVLDGRHGTFVLQHSGTMNRGAPSQSVTVVPDSATGDLTGLSGTMTIEIVDKTHLYTFEYTLERV
jgi:hypothetical protein